MPSNGNVPPPPIVTSPAIASPSTAPAYLISTWIGVVIGALNAKWPLSAVPATISTLIPNAGLVTEPEIAPLFERSSRTSCWSPVGW